MSSINFLPAIAADQVRATAAIARVSLVVEEAPQPPAASSDEIKAGRDAIRQAEASANAAIERLRQQEAAYRGRGIVA